MHIYVKVLKGNEIEVAVSPSHTIEDVKAILEMQFCMPAAQQKLVYKGKTLTDGKRLSDYHISDGDKLFLFQKKGDMSGASTPITPGQTSVGTPILPSEMGSCTTTVLWDKLYEFLQRHFTKSDARKVLLEFQKDFYGQLKNLSLDDIERLAASKLRVNANGNVNGHERMT
ncbi:ubiquitin-like protein 4A-A [Mizuhopecten yessoensis]|uniref:Ubiquitin-like protein 4A-A n=1 Tax=Mizuhopecten yessoensis TaxID=6573 RepID=A0A210Q4D2_MIZYE|nr:ubiquitin-like protein 4A-A [Mizuhopecten yessoensis]OWF43571.1 Ubiquitin-like protein 4A-A [Mizuhopecten yessoensis]